jgi:hypothetical protein
MNSALHFLHIYRFWKKNLTFKLWEDSIEQQVYQGTSLYKLFYIKIKMAFASYETLGFESWLYNLPILTLSKHIVGLSI